MAADSVTIELRELDEREREVHALCNVGMVSDRAARLQLAALGARRRQLRQGLAWSQERGAQATLK